MAEITIDDQVYPVPELDDLSFAEWRVFKQFGVENVFGKGAELFQDPDALAALVVIVKRRSGVKFDTSVVEEMKPGKILLRATEDDADPPSNRAARRAKAGSGA